MSDALSHASFFSAASAEADGRARVPPIPAEGRQGCPFRCSYCGRTISVRNRVQWKMHVFSDLQSYICTHTDCQKPLTSFPTRALWAKHELEEHFSRLQWHCSSCDRAGMAHDDYKKHLAHANDITVAEGTDLEFLAVPHSKQRTVADFENQSCPLCFKTSWQSGRAYATHLGQHMEEISLAVLPKIEDEESSSLSEFSSIVEEAAGSDSSGPRDDPAIAPFGVPEESAKSAKSFGGSQIPASYKESLAQSSNPDRQSSSKGQLSRVGRALGSRLARWTRRTKRPSDPPSVLGEETDMSKIKRQNETDDSHTLEFPSESRMSVEPLVGRGDPLVMRIMVHSPRPNPQNSIIMLLTFDTGAYCPSLLSVRQWQKLNASGRCVLEPVDYKILTLDGDTIPELGMARKLKWQIEDGHKVYSTDFLVVDMSTHDAILTASDVSTLEPPATYPQWLLSRG
ncbi:hypothetical protein BDV06DRAFT_195167 [Aspergillus oleicola]